MNEKTVLAIDPGSSKCGMALVTRDEKRQIRLQWRAIVDPSEVIDRIQQAKSIRPFEIVVVGNGTAGQKIIERIREQLFGLSILVIDEKDTTLQARERYWVTTQRKGWRRLLPATLQVPPEPIDDFAALILAERVLNAS